MAASFDDIMLEAAEMVGISARMAEEEMRSTTCDPIVLESLMGLTRACKSLMLQAKRRARWG
jgi:hypothetical protein